MHSMNFGATAGDYYAQANDEILVVLQTESPRGVENAEAIYSLPGVDAIFIGPNDLRFQMRDARRHVPHRRRARSGHSAASSPPARRSDCPTGIHAMDPEDALERAEQGMQFIAIGSDLRMMTQKAQEILDVIRPGRRRQGCGAVLGNYFLHHPRRHSNIQHMHSP